MRQVLRLALLLNVLEIGTHMVAGGGVDPVSVRRVHLVQANHLDLGFSDLMTRVMNRYLTGGEMKCPRSGLCHYRCILVVYT